MEGQGMIWRSWVNTLPEIVQGLMKLLGEQGREVHGADEAWADRGKCLVTPGLHIIDEGDSDNGPYRFSVYACSTEEGIDTNEPLLRLEIRSGLLWINEVKRLVAESKKAEPMAVA
jgi:hypothetical protein